MEDALIFQEEHRIGAAFQDPRQFDVQDLPDRNAAGQQIQQNAGRVALQQIFDYRIVGAYFFLHCNETERPERIVCSRAFCSCGVRVQFRHP